MSISPIRSERGVALLSALFAVALLTIVVIEMTDSTLVHTHLTRNAGNAMAAQLLARSAVLAGEALLANDDANPEARTCRNAFWHDGLPPIPVGDGFASVRIADEAGKLDLNSVRDERYREAVKTLFSSLELDPSLVDRVAAWISGPNDPPMETGPASDYCALAMSCTPRQQPLQTLEELLVVRGFDDRVLAQLRPYVTVVQRSGGRGTAPQLNALTADPLVLAAIGCDGGAPPPDCPAATASEDSKKEFDQTTFEDWKRANCASATVKVTKQSNLFSIVAQGVVGDVAQTVRTTVKRKGNDATRLWWQEVPLHAPMPVEAR